MMKIVRRTLYTISTYTIIASQSASSSLLQTITKMGVYTSLSTLVITNNNHGSQNLTDCATCYVFVLSCCCIGYKHTLHLWTLTVKSSSIYTVMKIFLCMLRYTNFVYQKYQILARYTKCIQGFAESLQQARNIVCVAI